MEERVYIVKKIEGEYTTLTDAETGEELFIALSLLPLGVDVNSKLKYKDFEFELI